MGRREGESRGRERGVEGEMCIAKPFNCCLLFVVAVYGKKKKQNKRSHFGSSRSGSIHKLVQAACRGEPICTDDISARLVTGDGTASDDSEAREILASAYPSRPKEWVAPLRPVVVGSRRRCFGAAPPSGGCSSTIRTVGAVAPWWPIDERPRAEGSASV